MTTAIRAQEDGIPEEATEDAEDANPESPVRYMCMKYNRYREGEAVACQDPDLYCKFRSSCLIHYKDKRRRRDRRTDEA